MKTAHFIRIRRLLMGILILCFGASAFAYPYSQDDIQQLLIEEAGYQGVSPSLVLAIAKVESDFNPSALSHAGAKGVMQIMPATAKNGFQVEAHELFNAKVNIQIGVAFIKQLLEQYDGQVDIALSHYNGGSRVKRPDGALRIIPATHAYVKKVKMYLQRYKNQGYDDNAAPAQHRTLVHQQSNEQAPLSYAQQMALDKLDYRNIPKQNASAVKENEINEPNPRINQLQDLREHNLTRLLPAKKAQGDINTSYDMSQNILAERDRKLAGKPFIRGPKQSHRKILVAETSPLRVDLPHVDKPLAQNVAFKPVSLEHANSKQQQVASWEAVFD